MTRTPAVGLAVQDRAPVYVPGTESLAAGEIRVTVLGSGDPWIRRSQASGSLLIEVGNSEQDFFFFDLGSGSLANFTALMLPVEATTKVFLSHLHADHIGDIPGLIGSLAKAGRVDPVQIWGGGSEDPALGLAAFVEHTGKAMAWDTAFGPRPLPRRAQSGLLRGHASLQARGGGGRGCTPGVDAVFEEISASYSGPVTVTQDLTVFNITHDAVIARQAKVNDAAPPVHGPSQTSPALDPQPAPPAWWTEALLNL